MTSSRLSQSAAVAALLIMAACGATEETPATTQTEVQESTSTTATREVPAAIVASDKFSYANPAEIRVTHLALDLDVDFDAKTLSGAATLHFERAFPSAERLVLDTKGLTIQSVTIDGEDADYTLADDDAALGQKLSINVGTQASQVTIGYATSPDAEGLQWLAPEQTAGKEKPYLFSQAQALNARTIAPLQDTPGVRMTYSAKLSVPDGLLALMSAEQQGQNIDGDYLFDMPQPIPSYLLAIAVGDIKFKAINETIGVYAEDYILDAAAEEFSETPLMEDANERLYGPYRWGRYDLIVLPPSFPFGGMENPRLSFLTPTLVAGDKSLTNVVAHELAHSWSGNLVTNSTWRDAWLNEGFTSYVENRVMEDLYGRERAVMEQQLALADLKRDIAAAKRPELTQLKLPEDIAHPDDAFTQVAYVKGQFFLMFLEARYGRDAFDAFLKDYFDTFAFQSVTTEDFLEYMDANLASKYPDAVSKADITEWVYAPGLPETAANPQSDAFTTVDTVSASWQAGDINATDIDTSNWSTHEWLHFLNGLPDELTEAQLNALEDAFALTGTQNAETAYAWYMNTIPNQYAPADEALETFLMTVGRGKFIYRLYRALEDNGRGDWARRVYANARPGYHPIAQRRIDAILLSEGD